jgi:hypothetical protein
MESANYTYEPIYKAIGLSKRIPEELTFFP